MNKLLFLSLLLFMCFSKVNSQSALNFNYVTTLHSHENHNTVFSAKFTNGTIVMDTGYAEFFLNPPAFAPYQYLGNYYVLASFNRIPEDSDLTRMNGLGIQLLHYIPQQTYFVSIPSTVSFADVNLLVNTPDFWIKAIDSLPTAFRIDASVTDYINNVTLNTTPVIIAISLFDN